MDYYCSFHISTQKLYVISKVELQTEYRYLQLFLLKIKNINLTPVLITNPHYGGWLLGKCKYQCLFIQILICIFQ